MNILFVLGGLSEFISISLTQIIFGVLLLLVLKGLIVDKKYYIQDFELSVYIFLFFIATLVSALVGVDPFRSLKELGDIWIIFFSLVGFFLVDRSNVKYALYPLVTGGVIASTYGFYQIFYVGLGRASAFFSHSLTYGNVMAIALCITFSLILFDFTDSKKEKRLLWGAGAVIFAGLALGSRGPFLYGVITLGVMFIFRFRLKGLLYCALIAVAAVTMIMFIPGMKQSFMKFFSNDYLVSNTSFGTRIVLWKASLAAVVENPFFGTGYKSFDVVRQRIDVPVGSMAHAHNSYLQILVLHGFFGLIALLAVFFRGLLTYIRNRGNVYSYMGIFVMLVFMLEGLSENNFSDSEVAMLFWFITGLCLNMSYKKGV